MRPAPYPPARPAIMQDILHPPVKRQRTRNEKTALPRHKQEPVSSRMSRPEPSNMLLSTAAKTPLALSDNAGAVFTPAAALTIPQRRFGYYSRDDLVWVTAGSLMAMLLISCVATLGRLGLVG